MPKNVGTIDKILRIAVAILILVATLTGTVTGTLAVILCIFGIAFVLTSFIGTCFLYIPLNINTKEKKSK